MHTFAKVALGVALFTALSAGALAPAHAQTSTPYPYTLTDLGVLPGGNDTSLGEGVNDSGQVAGESYTTNSGGGRTNDHAFLSGPGGGPLQDLGTLPGGAYSLGYGVNAGGQVAGFSSAGRASARASSRPAIRIAVGLGRPAFHVAASGGIPITRAFLSGPNGGALQNLGTLPGGTYSLGYGVNDSGQVTGDGDINNTGDGEHAFLSGPGGGPLRDLGTLPGGGSSYGLGVNNSGQVTGYAYPPSAESGGYSYQRAFLSGANGGPLRDLGTLPGGLYSEGQGVNAGGQVTGAADAPGSREHAFLSGPNGAGLHDLGVLPGGSLSAGLGVNDSGQAVGVSDTAGSPAHAFLYSGGVLTDLNTLIAPGSGLTLTVATHISNNGFISGTCEGADGSGVTHAFLLTPNPVNVGPKITVTAGASGGVTGTLARTVTVTSANTGGAAADLFQITGVTLNGAPPAPAPVSPSPVPTTPNNLSNRPGMNTQQNGFVFSPPPGTKTAVLRVSGHYTDPNTGAAGTFTSTLRLPLP